MTLPLDSLPSDAAFTGLASLSTTFGAPFSEPSALSALRFSDTLYLPSLSLTVK